MNIHELEDDVKMELGYIGDHVELEDPASLREDDDVADRRQHDDPMWYPGSGRRSTIEERTREGS